MGVRNEKKETLGRLRSKTLDAQFLQEIQQGLNCSPFEAQAVLEVAKEVYLPFLDSDVVKAPPGKITLVAIGADEPSGKPIDDCRKQTVCLERYVKQVEKGRWPTPQARDADQRGAQAKRYWNPERSNDLPDAVAASGINGQLNPMWVEWLMGFPLGFTDCED